MKTYSEYETTTKDEFAEYRYLFEERAGIYEYEGGYPRGIAEEMARKDVMVFVDSDKLHPKVDK